jgi:hypothetical protein
MEHAMDELPDLQSDADVDALMARLRARIDVHTVTSSGAACGQSWGEQPNGLGDLLAAQDIFAATVVRAMDLMVATLEELTAEEVRRKPAAPRSANARRRVRRTAR